MKLTTSWQTVGTSIDGIFKIGMKYSIYDDGNKDREYGLILIHIGIYATKNYKYSRLGDTLIFDKYEIPLKYIDAVKTKDIYKKWVEVWSNTRVLEDYTSEGNTEKTYNWSWSSYDFGYDDKAQRGSVTIPKGVIPYSTYASPSKISGDYNFKAGSQGTIKIVKTKNVDYKHNVYAYYGNDKIEDILTKAGDGSYSWTPKLSSWGKVMPKSIGPIKATLHCITYRDSKKIGETTYQTNISMPNDSNTKPTISIDRLVMKNVFKNRYNLSGICTAEIKCTPVTKYSATVKSISIKCGSTQIGKTSDLFESEALEGYGSTKITATVTDSRGLTGTDSKTITITSYNRPSLTQVVSVRCDVNGNEDSNGIYFKPSFYPSYTDLKSGTTHYNNCTVKVRWRRKGTSTWTNYIDIINNVRVDTTQAALTPTGLNPNYSYELQYYIQDEVGTAFNLKAVTVKDLITTSFVLVDFAKYGKSMAIGKISEASSLGEEKAFEVGIPGYFYSGLYGKEEEDNSFINILDRIKTLYKFYYNGLPSNDDADNATSPGIWHFNSGTNNAPGDAAYDCIVLSFSTTRITQIAVRDTSRSSPYIWKRTYYSGSWGHWYVFEGREMIP